MSVCFKSKHHSGLDSMWPAAVCQQRLEHSSGEGQETSRPSDSPITSELPRNKTARQSGCPRTSRPSWHTYLTKKEAVYPQNPAPCLWSADGVLQTHLPPGTGLRWGRWPDEHMGGEGGGPQTPQWSSALQEPCTHPFPLNEGETPEGPTPVNCSDFSGSGFRVKTPQCSENGLSSFYFIHLHDLNCYHECTLLL